MNLRNPRGFFLLLAGLLIASRMCHVGILWEGDSYPLAAARQVLFGKFLYRDIWFDKPPLLVGFYLLSGAARGWLLRLADALYILLASYVAYRFAGDLWSKREGLWAAGLLGFYLIFGLPSAVIPVASDMLLVAPHLAAVWMAWRKRPVWSGALSAVAFWISPKGVFVAAACAIWYPAGVLWMVAGFAGVSVVMLAGLAATGSLTAWWEQVFVWGQMYASSTFLGNPARNGLMRTIHWAGFHLAAVVAAAWFVRREHSLRWIGWLVLAALGVTAGMRFFPRYYLLLLPVVVLMASRGFPLLGKRRLLVSLLLLIPLLRFGTPYVWAIRNAGWADTAMDRDSDGASLIVGKFAKPGDTLFVWGYRPEIYVYTGLRAATPYLDSQPLTGVPADRHLTQWEPVEREAPRVRRMALTREHPTFVLDGLGIYNPRLAMAQYPELHEWLKGYREVGRTAGTVVYRLR